MRRIVLIMGLCAACVVLASAALAQSEEKKEPPRIQMAILLDTSGSMQRLIDQAKSQLWKIVNEFATSKQNGETPDIEVALYEYGNNGISSETGWVRMLVPLSTDLDLVSEKLFALSTNGGQEYCGTVIKAAANELKWSESDNALKVIFIAGNEPFTQGHVDYRESCKAAITKGIMVNTIHCGPYDLGVKTKWKDGADLADGKYMNIDLNQEIVHIDSPQDKEIEKLGQELNKTYVPYGAKGKEGEARQEKADRNAQSAAPGSNVQRQLAKSKSQYTNAGWDLVDAVREGRVKLEDIKDEDLPENMRKMSLEEKKAYIEAQAKERAGLQKQVSALDEERKKHVAEKKKELAESGEETLDSAMIKAVREQAKKKKFEFEEEPKGK